jgi:hypothetical protein
MIDHNEQPDRIVSALSSGGARRRRVEGGRQRAVKIRFTDAEYAEITARAAESNVSIQWLLVAGALTRKTAADGSHIRADRRAGRPAAPGREPGEQHQPDRPQAELRRPSRREYRARS